MLKFMNFIKFSTITFYNVNTLFKTKVTFLTYQLVIAVVFNHMIESHKCVQIVACNDFQPAWEEVH